VVALSVLALIGLAVSSEAIHTTPVLAWSNARFFQDKQQVKEVLNVESLGNLFSGKGSLESKPANIVLFVSAHLNNENFFELAAAHSLNPNGGVFTNLKNLVESSASSLVVPHVTSTSEGKSSEELIKQLAASIDGTVTVLSEDGKSSLSIPSTSEKISSFTVSEESAVTNLIVVMFKAQDLTQFRSDDAIVEIVCKQLSGSSYVAVFTGNTAKTSSTLKRMPEDAPSMTSFHKRYAQENEHTSTNIWNSGVVSGLIISIPFLIILCCGLRCSFAIQSEVKFENQLQSKKNL